MGENFDENWRQACQRLVNKKFIHVVRFTEDTPHSFSQRGFRGEYDVWEWEVDQLHPDTGELMDTLGYRVTSKVHLRKLAEVFPEGTRMKGKTIRVTPITEDVPRRDGNEGTEKMNSYKVELLEGEWWL